MTADVPTCRWPTGTAFTGPRTCGKTAKARTVQPGTINKMIPVCGVHVRSAESWSKKVVPLNGEENR